jgi:hypothetical protein
VGEAEVVADREVEVVVEGEVVNANEKIEVTTNRKTVRCTRL